MMKRACSVLLLVAMTANCAARGPALSSSHRMPSDSDAEQPGPTGAAAIWRQFAERLPAGATVRVATSSGDRFTAVLLGTDADGVRLNAKTRVPEPIRHVRYDTITRLEVASSKGASMAKAAAVGAGVGAGVFVGLLMLALSGWD